MIKRSFLGFSKSYLAYDRFTGPPEAPTPVSISGKAVFVVKGDYRPTDNAVAAAGDRVKTGQKLAVSDEPGAYATSSVSGSIAKISGFAGDFGKMWTEITVTVEDEGRVEDDSREFNAEPDLQSAADYLSALPGAPDFSLLANPDKPIHTIVVNGVDRDLLSTTALHAATADIANVTRGIGVLKQISGIEKIVLVVTRDTIQGYGHIGAEAKAVDSRYPAGLPKNIMRDALGISVPAGKSCEDMGVCFFSAEAVASMGRAYDTGRLPVEKTISLLDKAGTRRLISAKIGTPVRDIFTQFGMTPNERDRIIFGGPMTGTAIFSEDQPVLPDTDAILLQDIADIPLSSDTPCINCGECIRVCPTRVPVNMLVRFLEARQYESAADEYDLYSCVECGLCSFVCVSKIPIFQYIKLAKFELDRIQAAEAANE